MMNLSTEKTISRIMKEIYQEQDIPNRDDSSNSLSTVGRRPGCSFSIVVLLGDISVLLIIPSDCKVTIES